MNEIFIEKKTKVKISKAIITVALSVASICIWFELTIPTIHGEVVNEYTSEANNVMMLASILLLAGLYLGSRGIGEFLTLKNLLKQVFVLPCVIPATLYIMGLIVAFVCEVVTV